MFQLTVQSATPTRRMFCKVPTRAFARNSTILSTRISYLPLSLTNTGFRGYSNSQSPPKPSRSSRHAKRAGYTALALGLFWEIDREFNASAVGRNLNTLWTCAIIAADYKLNFTPENSAGIPAIHERVADRIFSLLTSNGGLYIKIGQAIANNSAVLPPAMQTKFAKLFDDAPQIPFTEVQSVFESEFHRPLSGPDGVFEYFDEKAMASASIAQVHKAKLKDADGGAWVAVKVQKPAVGKQVNIDLAVYALVMRLYEYAFEMPVMFVVDFIGDHLRKELDFIQEAQNATDTAELISREPRLAGKVYVPKVYQEYTTRKVMTAEWIDGVRMTDTIGIKKLLGEIPPSSGSATPLKGGISFVMQTMVELFSAQIFDWGLIHCDPHPGNMILRPNPTNPAAAQLVLLDHGLYVRASPTFQRQYASLWRALMTLDVPVIKGIAGEWGIGAPDFFASATLMRPVEFAEGDGEAPVKSFKDMDHYERSVVMKEKLKNFLSDTDKMPKELVFIGRNMRIVQGNNQLFGSPVNRINIIGTWASRSLTFTPNLSFAQRMREYYGYFVFKSVMWTVDFMFTFTRLKQWWKGSKDNEGFEDELEKTMRMFAKDNFGMEINEGAIYSG